jgi:hypothetical protein
LPDDRKDLFNSAVPAQDASFIPIAAMELTQLFGNPTRALAQAQFLLPDIMTFDTSSRDGFLNGRQLIDDVIDAELNLLTSGAVTTDNVVNDSVFSSRFPYLGKPNPKKVTLQALQVAAQAPTSGKPVTQSGGASKPREGSKSRTNGLKSKAGESNNGGLQADAPGQNAGNLGGTNGKTPSTPVGPTINTGGLTGNGVQIGVRGQDAGNPGTTPGVTSSPLVETKPNANQAKPKTGKPKSKTTKPKSETGVPKSETNDPKSETGVPKS